MTNYKIIYYQKDNQQIEIRQDGESGQFYFRALEIAKLFNKSAVTITRRINELYEKHILNRETTFSKNEIVGRNSKIYQADFYTLDVVLEVGRSLKSIEGQKLKQYLIENYSQKYEIEPLKDEEVIIYNNGDISIDVRVSPKEDTVWLTQYGISMLYQKEQSVISKHIKNILEEGELDKNQCFAKNAYRSSDGKIHWQYSYNLDMVLAVGYRTSGKRAIEFRKWVSGIIHNYLIKGYAINPKRAVVDNENYLELKSKVLELEVDVFKTKEDIKEIKNEISPKQIIFEDGTYFDSYKYVEEIFQRAKQMIEVIDPYIDDKALKIIAKSNKNIRRVIYTSSYAKIDETDKELFQKQYGNLNVIIKDNFHDRFILNEKEIYLVGSSLNYLGNKLFMIIKIEDKEIASLIRHKYPIV